MLAIAVDTAERYPWKFPEASVSRRKLAVGDYALLEGGEAVAVVERKSFDNLLSDLGALQALHHQLADLASWPVAALVVEAQLADFLDEKRLRSRWPASFVARALAEMSALHPKLPIIFAGNRKLANLWTERFLQAVTKSRQILPQLNLLAPQAKAEDRARGAGLDAAIRAAVLGPLAPEFSMAMLAARFPEVPGTRLTRVVGSLRTEGQVSRRGAGRGARWVVGG